MVTGVDTVQDEPLVVRTHEEGAHDEFVDCPDDLVSSQAPSPAAESWARHHPFRNDTEDNQNKVSEDENKIIPQDSQVSFNLLLFLLLFQGIFFCKCVCHKHVVGRRKGVDKGS